MTDCRDVKRALLADHPIDGLQSHLDECEPCAELARDGQLAHALDADRSVDVVPDAHEIFVRLTTQVEADENAVGWLKSRPTWIRQTLAALTVAAATMFGLIFLRRPDLDVYPQTRMLVSILLLAGLLFMSLAYSLRPTHKRALSRSFIAAAVVGALVLSFGLSVTPSHYQPDPSILPRGEAWLHALRCLYLGALVGLPVYVVSRLLDRSRDPSHALLAAGAAGLTGQLVLFLHCPIADASHLLSGHASVAVIYFLIVWGIVLLERRLRPTQ